MSYDARRLVNRLAASMRKSTPDLPGPPGFTTIEPRDGLASAGSRATAMAIVAPSGAAYQVAPSASHRSPAAPEQSGKASGETAGSVRGGAAGVGRSPGLVESRRRGRCERGRSTSGRGAGGCSEGKPRPHSGSHQGNAILSADAHAACAPGLLVTTERDRNPTQYKRFRTEREQPFHDLAALITRRPRAALLTLAADGGAHGRAACSARRNGDPGCRLVGSDARASAHPRRTRCALCPRRYWGLGPGPTR